MGEKLYWGTPSNFYINDQPVECCSINLSKYAEETEPQTPWNNSFEASFDYEIADINPKLLKMFEPKKVGLPRKAKKRLKKAFAKVLGVSVRNVIFSRKQIEIKQHGNSTIFM